MNGRDPVLRHEWAWVFIGMLLVSFLMSHYLVQQWWHPIVAGLVVGGVLETVKWRIRRRRGG